MTGLTYSFGDNCHVSMLGVLEGLGFVPDTEASMYGITPVLYYDFGNVRVTASQVPKWGIWPIIMLGGILEGSLSIKWLESEIPTEVESVEQGIALLTWCLDKSLAGGTFKPARPATWLETGRQNYHLLPWERQRVAFRRMQAEYEACPHCFVPHAWLKLALRELTDAHIAEAGAAPVVFAFDGEVLTIRCYGLFIALAGTGKPWPHPYAIGANALGKLPRRLPTRGSRIDIWEHSLQINRQRIGSVEIFDAPDRGAQLSLNLTLEEER